MAVRVLSAVSTISLCYMFANIFAGAEGKTIETGGALLASNFSCGSILHPFDGEDPEPGWDVLCYITSDETDYFDYQCNQLLADLPDVGDAHNLLVEGGNYGCFFTKDYPNPDIQTACQEDYQHMSSLSVNCPTCIIVAVCIRYPATIY